MFHRLFRFGYQYLAAYFALAGVRTLAKEEHSGQQAEEGDLNKELMKILVAIIYPFSGKLYGRHSAWFRKPRRCVKATLTPERVRAATPKIPPVRHRGCSSVGPVARS